ncbi:hypothetical protein B296_00045120 [Ensete ventricosum]|uniref:Uncharacterized protein n=1 Tax=Ensete ventricosum TaxID=4639 RepID=A0A426X9I9_ENSVE|nr:hypothetical protein B296_00045120 [Ensete ventricosum]
MVTAWLRQRQLRREGGEREMVAGSSSRGGRLRQWQAAIKEGSKQGGKYDGDDDGSDDDNDKRSSYGIAVGMPRIAALIPIDKTLGFYRGGRG